MSPPAAGTLDGATLVEGLARMGLPAVVVDGRGRLLWANRAADAPEGLSGPPAARALARLAMRTPDRPGPYTETGLELGGAVRRLAAVRLELGGAPAVLAVLLPPRGGAPSRLEGLLSATERRLVHLICSGRNLREAAVEMRVSYHTARKYMQTVFQKTGARRQADVVAFALGRTAFSGGQIAS